MIVPAFERQPKLVRALNSIAVQDDRPERIIVVDDGSQPRLPLQSGSIGGIPITVIRHDHNRGPAAARRTGLLAAESEWVSFLDCDDQLLPGSLAARWSHLISAWQSSPPLTIYGCGWIEEQDGAVRPRAKIPRESEELLAYASGCWFSPGSCVIMNRSALLEAGVLPDENLRRLEDFDWFFSLALKGARLCTLRKPAVMIERRRSLKPELVAAGARAILSKWRALPVDQPALKHMSAYLDLEIASANYYAGRWFKAAGFLARSLASVPRMSLHLSPGWETSAAG